MRTSMSFQHIAALRLQSQQLSHAAFTTPAALLAWMGAVQAQEFPMALWAIGLRLPGSTLGQITEAFNKGEILRTHVLRPTWHFVANDDLPWMLELTAPHIRKSMISNEKKLELTATVFKKSNKIIRSPLNDAVALTREQVIQAWEKAGIRTGEYRSGHLLAHAELDGIVCSGPLVNGKQSYALLSNRVQNFTSFDRDMALKKLAHSYFQSRGPQHLPTLPGGVG